MEKGDIVKGFEVLLSEIPAGLSREIRSCFVAYELNKEKCPKGMRTPGVKRLETAMEAYKLAFKRYRYMIKTGRL